MPNHSSRTVLLVGNGPHAREYARIFREGLDYRFTVSGPNVLGIERFQQEEGAEASIPLDRLTKADIDSFDFVVATTSPDSLEAVVGLLVSLGVKALLVEKPVTLNAAATARLDQLCRASAVFCRVAYNRRYYQSVRKLKSILADEPPICASFDFTELSRQIKSPERSQATTERWALVNSCHVFDTVKYLLGDFEFAATHQSGADLLDWHPAGATFLGYGRCGVTPITYATSWLCPGRWNIEVMTERGRYKLSPIERLQVVRHDSFQWTEIDAGYEIDVKFKPGLFGVVRAFDAACENPTGEACDLPTLQEAASLARTISRVVGYPE